MEIQQSLDLQVSLPFFLERRVFLYSQILFDAVFSMFFDTILGIQHYFCYKEARLKDSLFKKKGYDPLQQHENEGEQNEEIIQDSESKTIN